ncbi:teichoic acid glycosyl transferase [Levilactobacillus zymae]|uniref:ArnT family glycosyltransferase n=1 Tax=Levilactobacillus zymae TaxID=267363 RepID=UPI0028BC5365|nr:teichoic acid glycosyl transferase [Levilactobacillus zymae]MDT6981358.1 teichoic acid glycosyl transferase [Levilactobacillus zymae]
MTHLKRVLSSHAAQYDYLLAIVGAFLMAFCSYTSPAYYFDVSPDNNAFFTVGKAMMHGIVPYKDIFEQKGPYVYFWHGLAYLVSNRSFLLIFVGEILTLAAAMILVHHLALRLRMTPLTAFLTALLSPVLFLYHPYFDYGDTVEFFTIPLLLSLVYLIVLLDRKGARVSPVWFALQGAFVGLVFLSKYTLLGGWIAFYLILGGYLLAHRQWRHLGRLVLWSGGGFLLTTVPWLVYFLAHGALGDFINVYILFNTHVYLTSSVSVFSNLIQSVVLLAQFYMGDVLFFILGILGTFVLIFQTDLLQQPFTKALYLLVFVTTDLLALYGYQTDTVYQYYQLIYFAFFVLPLIYFAKLFFDRVQLPRLEDPFSIVAVMILSLFLVLGVNGNVTKSRLFPNNSSITERQTKVPQQPAQVEFGRLMRARTPQHHRLTLLNYGSIDMGFYTAAGAVPSLYYFQNYNIPQAAAPQILREQVSAIKHQRVGWVVLNTPHGRSVRNWRGYVGNDGRITAGNLNPGTATLAGPLYRHYRLVAKHSQIFESTNVTYWLFQRKVDQ